jgi:ribosomal protein L37E
VAVNRAITCAHCGWTSYPRALAIPEKPEVVNWQAPANCERCGEALPAVKAGNA